MARSAACLASRIVPEGPPPSQDERRKLGFGPLWHLQFNREKLLNSVGADLESLLNARGECLVSTLQFPAERRRTRWIVLEARDQELELARLAAPPIAARRIEQ